MSENIKDFVFLVTIATIISILFAFILHTNVFAATIAGMALMIGVQNRNI